MSQATETRAALRWDPPGPGSWSLAADHYPRPVTAALAADLHVWGEATTAYLHDLGIPIGVARLDAVNGLPYVAMIPAGRQGAAPPPAWILRLAVRVTPSMRRAERRLAEVLRERPWNEGIRRWYDVQRPVALARLTALADVDPHRLDDLALADHIRACRDEMVVSLREHLALHAHDTLPAALLAVRMQDWGLQVEQAWALLAGASPASTGASDELEALRGAVAARKADDLEELRYLGSDVADALDAFLARHGWRLLDGYDIDGRCLAEAPSVVVALATAAPSAGLTDDREHDATVQAVRAAIPEPHRAEFDRLLREARAAYGLRDDNSAILTSWPAGLLRRAMLAAGRRLVDRGDLADAALVIEATTDEVRAALTGAAPLDEPDLGRRLAHRRSLRAADAPRTLGPPEPPMPEGLRGALGTVMRAMALVAPSAEGPRASDGPGLAGEGIGTTACQGRARLVLGAGCAIDEMEVGDVLVAPMTSPSYNLVLSLAAGLVTEEGDAMSHAAIMARELGIPAVVGAANATTEIHDGDLIEVDPATGIVRIVERSLEQGADAPCPIT